MQRSRYIDFSVSVPSLFGEEEEEEEANHYLASRQTDLRCGRLAALMDGERPITDRDARLDESGRECGKWARRRRHPPTHILCCTHANTAQLAVLPKGQFHVGARVRFRTGQFRGRGTQTVFPKFPLR